jgi:hypothetical protein
MISREVALTLRTSSIPKHLLDAPRNESPMSL